MVSDPFICLSSVQLWSSSTGLWSPSTGRLQNPQASLALASRAHLSDSQVLAGPQPTILSKQGKILFWRLQLAWQYRQVPAVECLSPGCNVDVRQALHISCRGCLHHHSICSGHGPAELTGREPWGQPIRSWTLCRCLHKPMHWTMAPTLPCPTRTVDCVLVKRLFHNGFSILFAITQRFFLLFTTA